jgi:hypothetical protein
MPAEEETSERDGALLTVWIVVNLVNLIQPAGFATRVVNWDTQRIVGLAIIGLSIPAPAAAVLLIRRKAGWRLISGPVVFNVFVALLLVVEYVAAIEWRAPARPEIAVPLLTLFFGSIILMGAPMYRLNRRLWTVTVGTTTLLLAAMAYAMARGAG